MKNPQKGFIVPILIVVIALLAIGGGVYYYNQSGYRIFTTTRMVKEGASLPDPKVTKTGDLKSEAVNKIQPRVPGSTQAVHATLKVVTVVTIGAGESDETLLSGSPIEFKISQRDTAPKEFNITGGKLTLQAIETHEDTDVDFIPYSKEICSRDRSWCQNHKDWMIINVNGTNIEFGREEIKQITFSNGLKINMVMVDIEGSSSNYYGSDGGFVIVK